MRRYTLAAGVGLAALVAAAAGGTSPARPSGPAPKKSEALTEHAIEPRPFTRPIPPSIARSASPAVRSPTAHRQSDVSDERRARAEALRAEIDSDHDGALSPGEFQAYRHVLTARMFAELDRDESGGLSKFELTARSVLAERFDAVDTDEDHELSSQEIDAYVQQQRTVQRARHVRAAARSSTSAGS